MTSPSTQSLDRRRRVTVGAVFAAATGAMVGAAPATLAANLPGNLGDPALITWILGWGWHALTTRPVTYFNGNILWPHPSTLAYSDLFAPLVAVYGPVWSLTHNWALALNVTVLALFGLSLVSMYCLARWLLASTEGAVVAALAYTFCGTNMAGWAHVQIQTLGFLPLALYGLLRTLDSHRWTWGAFAGVATALTALAAGYWGALWLVTLPVVVIAYVVAKRPPLDRQLVVALAALAGVAAVLFLPAGLEYLQFGSSHVQPLEPSFGLKARDLITSANGSYLWGRFNAPDAPQLHEHGAYPGVSVVLLGIVGAAALVRRRRQGWARAPEVLTAMVAGVAALLLALGPEALGVPLPFRLLHAYAPGFGGIRVTVRFAVLAWLALALLAGAGVKHLSELLPRRHWRPALAAALGVAVLLDLAAPLQWARLPTDASTLAVYQALSRRPRAPVVELPMVDPGTHPVDLAYVEAPRMLRSTLDWNKRVNGYSAFVPPGYADNVQVLNGFPSDASLARIGSLHVRYVVLHTARVADLGAMTSDEAAARIGQLPAGLQKTARRLGEAWLIDLGPTPHRG